MKILGFKVNGLPLFNKELFINFMPVQRINDDNIERMYSLFKNSMQEYYKNNIITFVGINASGKTTILKLITFIFHMLNSEPLHTIECKNVFENLSDNKVVNIETYFYVDNQNNLNKFGTVNYLKTDIIKENGKLNIVNEVLKFKEYTKIKTKESFFDFAEEKTISSRKEYTDVLLDDMSIMVIFNKKNNERVDFDDMLQYTNTNQLDINDDCPVELIKFLDPSVEYLKVNKSNVGLDIKLKFIGKDEIILSKLVELNNYLSSGTIKGINTYLKAYETFKNGGYLIIDELENHFNQEILSTLIRFFMDNTINKKGATLIFSTHFAEILDEFDRNDVIYIVENKSGITAVNLTKKLVRNDIKKSEAYKSGYISGTTPDYDSYVELRKLFVSSIKEG